MIELTDQDLKDLKLACESAMIGGMTIAEARKVVVRFTLLSKKLEEMFNERNPSPEPTERSAVPSDGDIQHGSVSAGDVGHEAVRKPRRVRRNSK